MFKKNIKVIPQIGRASNDPAKLLTPALVWGSGKSDNFTVCVCRLGWWDFYVGVTILYQPVPQEFKSA